MVIKQTGSFDIELMQMKALIERLRREQTVYSNTFRNLKLKERALLLRQIEGDQKTLKHFLDRSRHQENVNSGSKFSVENLRQSFQSLLNSWRKIEKASEATPASGPHQELDFERTHIAPSFSDPSAQKIGAAVDSYDKVMKNLGHLPDHKELTNFREKLKQSFEDAQKKLKTQDVEIEIKELNGKIKVQMKSKK